MVTVVCKELKMNLPPDPPAPVLEKRVNREIFKKFFPLFLNDAQSSREYSSSFYVYYFCLVVGGLLEAAELQEEYLLNPPSPEPEEESTPPPEDASETPSKGVCSPRSIAVFSSYRIVYFQ